MIRLVGISYLQKRYDSYFILDFNGTCRTDLIHYDFLLIVLHITTSISLHLWCILKVVLNLNEEQPISAH